MSTHIEPHLYLQFLCENRVSGELCRQRFCNQFGFISFGFQHREERSNSPFASSAGRNPWECEWFFEAEDKGG